MGAFKKYFLQLVAFLLILLTVSEKKFFVSQCQGLQSWAPEPSKRSAAKAGLTPKHFNDAVPVLSQTVSQSGHLMFLSFSGGSIALHFRCVSLTHSELILLSGLSLGLLSFVHGEVQCRPPHHLLSSHRLCSCQGAARCVHMGFSPGSLLCSANGSTLSKALSWCLWLHSKSWCQCINPSALLCFFYTTLATLSPLLPSINVRISFSTTMK